jgi:hypothetical protein
MEVSNPDTRRTLGRWEWTVFADVPAEDLRPMLATARRRTFRRGEVVFHQNDPADSLHLVVAGRFAVRTTTRLGEESLLSIRGPHDVFGELAVVSTESRTATVIALELVRDAGRPSIGLRGAPPAAAGGRRHAGAVARARARTDKTLCSKSRTT